MKNIYKSIIVVFGLFVFACKSSNDPTLWNEKKIDQWFVKKEWLNGWGIIPDSSINKREFAIEYFKNKERWDKAFTFLKNTDLANLEIKRTDIDGDNVYASVTDYLSKNDEDARYEAHQKYIDIQYVISGQEQEGIAPLSSKQDVLVPYDSAKDIEYMNVTQAKKMKASPEKFFIFFPSDLHCPGLKDGENTQVRKIVVKIKIN